MNILCKYEEKLICIFFFNLFIYLFICVFRKYMFCVQVYGKWAHWGHYNLYHEALKGLLLKNAP